MTRPKAQLERRRLEPREKVLLRALARRVTMLPGSSDKRFAQDMRAAAEMTERQLANLYRLAYRYRRQLVLSETLAGYCRAVMDGKINRWDELAPAAPSRRASLDPASIEVNGEAL